MTLDFAAWLLATPQSERGRFVFHLIDNRQFQRRLKRVSRIVSEIGERAGVAVNKEQGKFASCFVKMARLRGRQRHEIVAQRFFMSWPIRPECTAVFPVGVALYCTFGALPQTKITHESC
jgi:hypothetical protein